MNGRLEHPPCGVDEQVALAPLHLLTTVVATPAADTGGLDGLTLDAARARLGIPAPLDPQPLAQGGGDALPRPIHPQAAKIMKHRFAGWPFLGQETPRAPGAQLVEDRVEQRAPPVHTGMAGLRRGRQERVDEVPFGVGQIGGIEMGTELGVHVLLYPTPTPVRFEFSDGFSYRFRLGRCRKTASGPESGEGKPLPNSTDSAETQITASWLVKGVFGDWFPGPAGPENRGTD